MQPVAAGVGTGLSNLTSFPSDDDTLDEPPEGRKEQSGIYGGEGYAPRGAINKEKVSVAVGKTAAVG